MCCEGCNPAIAFSWVGGILVNLSLIFLVSWGTATLWPLGLGISIIYTALLFVAAVCLRKRKPKDTEAAVGLLFLLGVIGVGASGTILAYNTVGCERPLPPGQDVNEWIFPDDVDGATAEVKAWALESRWASYSDVASFAHTPASGTFFKGKNASMTEDGVMHSAGGMLPLPVDDLTNPTNFVAAAVSTVCFTAWAPTTTTSTAVDTVPSSSSPTTQQDVYCCSGGSSSCAAIDPNLAERSEYSNNYSPDDLLVANSLLWFKANPPYGSSANSQGVVYRSESPFTSATLVSRPVSSSNPLPPPPSPPALPPATTPGAPSPAPAPDSCFGDEGVRVMALATIFLATLPSLITSIVLWYKLQLPTMAFATFVGVSALVINIYAIIDPDGSEAASLMKWWFAIFGALWLGCFAAIKLAERSDEQTIAWAVNAGCIAYIAAIHSLTEVPITDQPLPWIAYNLLGTFPMIAYALLVSGVAAGLPVIIASTGLMLDAWRITFAVTDLVGDETLKLFLRFLVLGVVGAMIVGAGVVYARYRKALTDWVDEMAAKLCGPCRPKKVSFSDVGEKKKQKVIAEAVTKTAPAVAPASAKEVAA